MASMMHCKDCAVEWASDIKIGLKFDCWNCGETGWLGSWSDCDEKHQLRWTSGQMVRVDWAEEDLDTDMVRL